jgi:hypothetical protein
MTSVCVGCSAQEAKQESKDSAAAGKAVAEPGKSGDKKKVSEASRAAAGIRTSPQQQRSGGNGKHHHGHGHGSHGHGHGRSGAKEEGSRGGRDRSEGPGKAAAAGDRPPKAQASGSPTEQR